MTRSGRIFFGPRFEVDRPYFYAILKNNDLLFVGRVNNPNAKWVTHSCPVAPKSQFKLLCIFSKNQWIKCFEPKIKDFAWCRYRKLRLCPKFCPSHPSHPSSWRILILVSAPIIMAISLPAPPPIPREFTADHPFYFAILQRDAARKRSSSLFNGRFVRNWFENSIE